MKLYNSLTKQKEDFKPIREGKIDLYVCGVTVYDDCHLGHARVFVAFDMMTRFFRSQGFEVKYIRNITDIDDKIIHRALENGESIQSLTERYIQSMHEDSEKLGVIKPTHEPKATEYIPQMLSLIQSLIDKKMAYVGDDSDVYFSVESFGPYGELAHKSLDKLISGARVDIDLAKRSPLDFVLWKRSKENEPTWDAPWCNGRPGWHTECSAMVMDCLGNTIDIHGGGSDLKFPHHENERAQAEGATGERFVNTWMHVGFVQIDKEKMSKSLNNFFSIKDLLAQYEGEVIRYFLLASHYRSPVNYTEDSLELAKNALTTLYNALRGVPLESVIEARATADELAPLEAKFISAMEDDFNTPEAFAVLFELARELNIAKQEDHSKIYSLAATLKRLANVLGLLEKEPDVFLKGQKSDALSEIDTLIAERQVARETRNWVRADEIRKLLDEKEIVIEDTADGTLWRRK